jgi:hypothetical protein
VGFEVEDDSHRGWIPYNRCAEAKALGDFLHRQIVGQNFRVNMVEFFVARDLDHTPEQFCPQARPWFWHASDINTAICYSDWSADLHFHF